ncbi:nicotinate-nucleotide-dimethylbenzimidazole phosphoribosyltransferase [Rhodothalassium salexigens DSM 2132]|uniref:Nicotinate-nucleotide--dimethylbenzimidazole phosphoribosyltransferase n=1 Tax=Rhodothalassium salexigens DSM 2132 TaxID=1188247 RepID=A0A4V2SPK0_RHOSA|nr:nicotinate-nucleotide--dimethylbenzimidazole phosphoribosyltransferase [Rhodothalassium salexigens]MBB4211385.1 nicotinate-nucleotide--dimethylbenzimidazole phosphoribosyltransferase [Rhodothalassium salexigens DSM 2132]MBK1637718.1 nicotinate-nucleotide--dimethylbenzimidazole phosphoribosyltransferase [Rhodothalassium salexigens DSM 2132]TCP35306.1 nicotinate-nucleotide-dimethylbenzimidazole phosphoribosyltransferase [Rhodothalassium salexigens DSM 2132]
MTHPQPLPPFTDWSAVRQAAATLPTADQAAGQAARARQNNLTKPPGSLGRLEDVAVWLAGWQGTDRPRLDTLRTVIFAGNHGVATQGVSSFPPEVTKQMVANFAAGGAAINQLSRWAGADLDVIPLDLDRPTADFTQAPAMTADEALAAFNAGATAVPDGLDALVVGEMGIANTTAAAALAAGLLGGRGVDWVGPGTGLDRAGVNRKAEAVDRALDRHRDATGDPLAVMACLGGRELAAMAGAIFAARLKRTPVVLDGFVATAAAAVLPGLAAGALDHCLAGHVSAEPGHRRLLDALSLQPLLSLGMRLGEASGAVVALGLMGAAVATHNGMATFEEARVAAGTGAGPDREAAS